MSSLVNFTREIASCMSTHWEVAQVYERAVYIEQPETGATLVLRMNNPYEWEIGKGKLEVYGKFPDGIFIPDDKKVKEIYISASRGPKTVAIAIERRYLSAYIPVFKWAMERCRKSERAKEQRLELLAVLADAYGGKVINERDIEEVRFTSTSGNVYGTLSLTAHFDGNKAIGHDVNIDLHNVSFETALRVGKLLNQAQ